MFTSDRWREIANSSGIQLRISGLKAHSSLGIGEKYHGPLRRIYNKVSFEYPQLNKIIVLNFDIKAMNDTMGENGLVPSRLVFGIIPRFPILNHNLPTQRERLQALKLAQAEMNSIVAERRVLAALNKSIPSAADRNYKLGEKVLIYSETSKTWIGPYIVIDCTGRIVTVKTHDNSFRQTFNAYQVKPYYRDDYTVNFSQFKSGCDEALLFFTFITEVIQPHDPRAWKFSDAINKEIRGLIERGTWRVVLREEFPDNKNTLKGRFVLAIKDEGTGKEIWKARFVIQAYRYKLKKLMVHDINVIKNYSIKLIIA